MQNRLVLLLLLSATPITARDLAPPVARIPASPWHADAAEGGCLLWRSYSDAQDPITLSFRPDWNGALREISIATRRSGAPRPRDKARLALSDAPPFDAVASSFSAGDDRVTRIILPPGLAFVPSTATSILIDLGDHAPLALAIPNAKAAFAALDACQDKMMDQWGVFAWERRPGPAPTLPAVAAVGTIGDLIGHEDYPATSLAKHEEGTVRILWTIGIDGLAHDCKIIQSSGHPALDHQSCVAFSRARYKSPALDGQGKPIEVHAPRTVVWALPD